jgi:hypothetical protein
MFKIKIPNICQNEQIYVLDILLGEFLGLDFKVETSESDVIEITKEGSFDKIAKLTLCTSFFKQANKNWLKIESMPNLSLKSWKPLNDGINVNLVEPSIPVLYGSPGLERKNNHIHLNLDIFGSVFFMLSRYEELVIKKRDNHDRFSAKDSISYKSNFLNRPIVDEYLEILTTCLKDLWPNLHFLIQKPKTFISCDVDEPYDCTVETFLDLIKVCAGDLIKRRSFIEMLKRINRFCFNKIGIYKFDRNYTFDFYMSLCEQVGLKAAFYFIPSSDEPNNCCYQITDRKILKLIKKIHKNGFEIGVHGTYQSYNDKNKIFNQKCEFEKILEKKSINLKLKGNRQHFLRWDSQVTPDYLDAAGFVYDTSGGYADFPGFRYGTSKEFSMWSWQDRKKLNLKQRPLIVMDTSISKYMGLGYSKEALNIILKLKKNCELFGGVFNILWHNSDLKNDNQVNMLKEILR